MPSLLASAVRQHHAALAKAGGVDAAIALNGHDAQLRVVPLRGVVSPTDIGGQTATERRAEFGIAADELIINGVKVEPQASMTITLRAEDVGDYAAGVYAVVPGDSGRHCDPMDALGILYRTYTVYKGQP